MQIEIKNIDEIKPYRNNPRINDNAVDKVVESIKEFGFNVPIVIDKNNVIVAGHTRYEALRKLKIDEVPTIKVDNLTEEQVNAYRLADNKVAEFSSWDYTKLEEELNQIELNMQDFGFDFDRLTKSLDENPILDVGLEEKQIDDKYTKKVCVPHYEPKLKIAPPIEMLIDDEKQKELIYDIKKSNISESEKDFLIKASYRHLVFYYDKIAEFYAHASKECQELMEKSALVIIDFNDAIKNGYVELKKDIDSFIEVDYDEN